MDKEVQESLQDMTPFNADAPEQRSGVEDPPAFPDIVIEDCRRIFVRIKRCLRSKEAAPISIFQIEDQELRYNIWREMFRDRISLSTNVSQLVLAQIHIVLGQVQDALAQGQYRRGHVH